MSPSKAPQLLVFTINSSRGIVRKSMKNCSDNTLKTSILNPNIKVTRITCIHLCTSELYFERSTQRSLL